MSKFKLIIFLLAGSFLLALAVWPVGGEGLTNASAQTVPTKTPTGESQPITDTPPPPTDTPPSSGGEPNNPPPATATSGPPPATTPGAPPPTNTAAASGSGGSFLPTAAACGTIPTLQAKNIINIRSGPGTDYDVAGTMVFAEVRPIIGRAANADWWAIELPNGEIGWVSDPIVNVSGYIGGVPILEPPAINGNTPTPGTPWSPTPNALCPTETPTLTPTTTQTPSPAATSEITTEAAVSDTPEATATLPPTDTATPPPAEPSPTLPLVGENPTAPAVTPISEPPTTPDRNGWVLYAGIGLVVIGGAAYVLLSRR